MDLNFEHDDLASLDVLSVDTVALCVFEDERPLRTVAANVDWRLCGEISRCIQTRRLETTAGEQGLVPTRKRFPFSKVFVVGCGPSASFSVSTATERLRQCLHTAQKARVRSLALSLPGRSLEVLSPSEAVDVFFDVFRGPSVFEHLVVLDRAEAVKEMRKHFDKRRHDVRRNKDFRNGMA